jgi:hypothetical protein
MLESKLNWLAAFSLLFWDQRPLIWRISVLLSGGSASAYLGDQRPLIWLNSVELSLAIMNIPMYSNIRIILNEYIINTIRMKNIFRYLCYLEYMQIFILFKQAQLCNKLRLRRHLLHKRWAWLRRQASRWVFGPKRLFSHYIIISM